MKLQFTNADDQSIVYGYKDKQNVCLVSKGGQVIILYPDKDRATLEGFSRDSFIEKIESVKDGEDFKWSNRNYSRMTCDEIESLVSVVYQAGTKVGDAWMVLPVSDRVHQCKMW